MLCEDGSTPKCAVQLVLAFLLMRGSDSNECSQRCSPRLRYDLFVINIASTMLGYVYGRGMIKFLSKYLPMLLTSLPASGQTLNKNQDLCVKVAGQLEVFLVRSSLVGWPIPLVVNGCVSSLHFF